MEEKEKAKLLEIGELYDKLKNEPKGIWNGTYKIEPNGNTYKSNAEKLLNEVITLYNDFKPDYLPEQNLDALSHTCSKEVDYVVNDYNESIKPRAAKKRYTEFLNSISKANNQIKLDIYSLLKKVEEVKN